ncbi:MAG: hypothetical protein M5U26_16550 [Planctomycetota bacterium]|nr:hypothetical protein [Planctomycetota bacterium]
MPAPDRRKVALVTTTIYVPHAVETYLKNIARHGHAGRVELIVVGDRKTPAEAGSFLAGLQKTFGVETKYLDVPAQQDLLRRWPVLDGVIRYNCIQRRNVGYLQAGLDGADLIVSFDDDNFVPENVDYLAEHGVAGTEIEVPVVSDASGWWNICRRLVCDPPRRFYHRGYPKSRQTFAEAGGEKIAREKVRVLVNAGLWLKNPDVDATANIEEPLNVVRVADVDGSARCALAHGTWCPFNSQNTALVRELLPAMYLVVMLDWLRGYKIGRLDDIWQSYFIRAIADRLGGHVVYGTPVVTQDRNPHNFTKDLAEELGGYVVTERLVGYLREFKTGSRTWSGAYLDLIYHLRDCADRDRDLERPEREYLRLVTLGMAAWQEAMAEIQG